MFHRANCLIPVCLVTHRSGSNLLERANLEYNARNQLTLWGPTGQIDDYAKKEWGGLVRSYYKPRYALLFRMAGAALSANDTSPLAQWNQSLFAAAVLAEVELPWQTSTKGFPSHPEGDVIAVSHAMFAKYAAKAR